MNKSIKEMSPDELMELPTLGLDDTFEFNCRACGKCCKNRHDILLTPYDTFRVASHFKRTTKEIIDRHCEVYEGRQSHFPVVHVLPIPPDNACPFLLNKKCTVHAKKPVLCRVYPLARIFAVARDGESEGDEKPRYYFNGAGCKHEPKSITVREWIADVANEESEQAAKLWGDITATIYPLIQPDKLKVSTETRQQMFNILFSVLYLEYDMNKPFIPQFQENFEKLKVIFKE